jgi:hypothetical protein
MVDYTMHVVSGGAKQVAAINAEKAKAPSCYDDAKSIAI